MGYPRSPSSAPCKPPRMPPLPDRAVGRAWRRCGLRVGAGFAQDELHAQDPEQFQEPPGADLFSIAFQSRVGLLRDPQAQCHFALGQAGILAEGLQEHGQLRRGAYRKVFHTGPKLYFLYTHRRLYFGGLGCPQPRNIRYAGLPVSSTYSYPSRARKPWKASRSCGGTCMPTSTRPKSAPWLR